MSTTAEQNEKPSFLKRIFGKNEKIETSEINELPAQITPAGGLGDKHKIFEKNYGVNAGPNEWGRFLDNSMFVRFYEDRAIMIQTTNQNQPFADPFEALQKASGLLPKDAKLVEQHTQEEDDAKTENFLYESEWLQKVFDNKELNDTNISYCSLTLSYNKQGVHLITVMLGDSWFREKENLVFSKEKLF